MAKTKAIKKSTPSKAKLSGPEEVAEFLKKLDHPLKEVLKTVREIILGANKGITEHIKWNGPSFCFKEEDRVTTNIYKDECVMLVFHRGAKVKEKLKGPLIKDTTGLLQWITNDRAIVKLYSVEEVNEKKNKLKKVVSDWVKAG